MSTLVEVNTEYEDEYVYSKIQYDERHGWRNHKRFLDINNGSYFIDRKCAEDNGYNIISFNEFKTRYEPKLKIGDTFEHNGFICRVESEVLVWVYNKMLESYHKECDIQEHHLVITNKEFIKQLEENAQ